jgi:ribosomal protein S18 acetylase RimI-like enzyme
VFRIGTHADPAFLIEMLYEAVHWRDDGAEERPPLDELLNDPHHACYVQGWGRTGDTAVIAFDRTDEPVGAAWYRHFAASNAGYGFVAEDVPELAIAVFPEFRRGGVGSLLLGALVARARANGERGLSLSVERDNPAGHLYRRHGFVVEHRDDGADTMLLTLSAD